jgi:hypothetical protein
VYLTDVEVMKDLVALDLELVVDCPDREVIVTTVPVSKLRSLGFSIVNGTLKIEGSGTRVP